MKTPLKFLQMPGGTGGVGGAGMSVESRIGTRSGSFPVCSSTKQLLLDVVIDHRVKGSNGKDILCLPWRQEKIERKQMSLNPGKALPQETPRRRDPPRSQILESKAHSTWQTSLGALYISKDGSGMGSRLSGAQTEE